MDFQLQKYTHQQAQKAVSQITETLAIMEETLSQQQVYTCEKGLANEVVVSLTNALKRAKALCQRTKVAEKE